MSTDIPTVHGRASKSTLKMSEHSSLDDEVAALIRGRPDAPKFLEDVMAQQKWESDGHYQGRKTFILRVIKVCRGVNVTLREQGAISRNLRIGCAALGAFACQYKMVKKSFFDLFADTARRWRA